MKIAEVFGTMCVLVFLSGSCSAGKHNHDKLLELLRKSKHMGIREKNKFEGPSNLRDIHLISTSDGNERHRESDDLVISFQTSTTIRLRDFWDVDESNPRKLIQLTASAIDSLAESNVRFSIKNRDVVPAGLIVEQPDENTMDLVANHPIAVTQEQAETGEFPVLIEAVSVTDPENVAYMNVVIKMEERRANPVDVECQDPEMQEKYCLNGGTCYELKTWPDYDTNPDEFTLGWMHCHCGPDWMGTRCEDRYIDPNEIGRQNADNKMNMNDARAHRNQVSEELRHDEKKKIRENDFKTVVGL